MFVDNNPVQAGLRLGGREGGRGETVFVDTNPVEAGLSLGGGGREGDSVC